MKDFVKQLQTAVRAAVARGSRILNPPLAEDSLPLEVQGAMLEAVERDTQPHRDGRRRLPGNTLTVKVLVRADRQRVFRTGLANLAGAVVTRLTEIRCDIPPGFRVVLTFASRRPAAWPASQRFAIAWSDSTNAPAAGDDRPPLRATVLRGRATRTSYLLSEPVVRFGRTEMPIDDQGGIRQNQVAFVGEDEHTRTVGRAHCRIAFDRDHGVYRLFDEGSANGTSIVRDGTVIRVLPHDPVGLVIVSGDELRLGTAAVRLAIDSR